MCRKRLSSSLSVRESRRICSGYTRRVGCRPLCNDAARQLTTAPSISPGGRQARAAQLRKARSPGRARRARCACGLRRSGRSLRCAQGIFFPVRPAEGNLASRLPLRGRHPPRRGQKCRGTRQPGHGGLAHGLTAAPLAPSLRDHSGIAVGAAEDVARANLEGAPQPAGAGGFVAPRGAAG